MLSATFLEKWLLSLSSFIVCHVENLSALAVITLKEMNYMENMEELVQWNWEAEFEECHGGQMKWLLTNMKHLGVPDKRK